MNGAFCNMPAIFLFIIFFRPGPTESIIHQATSGRLIASESATTSRSSRYISRPSVKTSALVAPSSASSKNASRAAGIGRSTAARVNRHRGVWSARSCVFSASSCGRSASIQAKSDGRSRRYGRVSKPAARFNTRSQPSAIASGNGVVDDLGARDEPPAVAARHREPWRRSRGLVHRRGVRRVGR